jgi:hypothetical protein
MIETYPLERAAEAYARMMSGKAQFPRRADDVRRRKGTSGGSLDGVSHDVDRWALDLLQRGRPDGRADDAPVARTALVVADVRAALCAPLGSVSPGGAGLPGFGHSDWPDPKAFAYTFDHYAEIVTRFTEALGLKHYTLYMQDYGGPVGFRMALAHPERIEGLIVQDAVAHNEGLGANWTPRRAFWADRTANEAALRTNLLSRKTTRTRHVGNDPNVERYDPDLWTDEFALPESSRVRPTFRATCFNDYRTNVDAYPRWQRWMRDTQPRLLVIWGKYDLSFELSEPEAIGATSRTPTCTSSMRGISRWTQRRTKIAGTRSRLSPLSTASSRKGEVHASDDLIAGSSRQRGIDDRGRASLARSTRGAADRPPRELAAIGPCDAVAQFATLDGGEACLGRSCSSTSGPTRVSTGCARFRTFAPGRRSTRRGSSSSACTHRSSHSSTTSTTCVVPCNRCVSSIRW